MMLMPVLDWTVDPKSTRPAGRGERLLTALQSRFYLCREEQEDDKTEEVEMEEKPGIWGAVKESSLSGKTLADEPFTQSWR